MDIPFRLNTCPVFFYLLPFAVSHKKYFILYFFFYLFIFKNIYSLINRIKQLEDKVYLPFMKNKKAIEGESQ